MRSGWKTEKLGDVCQMIKRGVAPKYIEDGGLCVINQKCIRDHTINYELTRRHNLEAKAVNPERYIQVGDVLINSTGTGTLGRVAQVRNDPPESSTVDTHVTIVRPRPEKFHNDFFGYMLIKIEEEIEKSGEGTSGQTELARTKLENEFLVSYPEDKNEQKRIVAILDAAFAGIDQAIANTEKNLASARELFESTLNTIFIQKGEGWEEDTFSNLIESQTIGLSRGKKEQSYSYDYPYIKMHNITNDNRFNTDDVTCVKATENEVKKYTLECGDLLFNTRNSKELVGKNCLYLWDNAEPVLFNNNIMRIRFKPKLRSDFAAILFDFYARTGRLESLKSGTTNVSAIYYRNLENFSLEYPTDTLKQEEISKKIRQFINSLENLNVAQLKKISALNELKQSLLQKAFSGELTADMAEDLAEAAA